MTDQTLPLCGLRVIEPSSSIAAPYCTWIVGAEVIKIESA